MVNGQQYLDTNYPNANRASITELDLSNKNLEGRMTLSGFTALLKLNLSFNMITGISYTLPSIQQIDVSHNLLTSSSTLSGPPLQKLNCSFNKITSYVIDVPTLTHLDSSNNLLSLLSISSNILTELNCSNNPITLLPLNITSKLTSFDCMGIQFSKTDTAKTSLPISPTSANSLPISPMSSNSCNSFNLVIGLGIPLFLSILGWIALGIIFFYKRRFKKVLLIPGDSHST
ncbi:plant intracellular ras-group-related lrr protein 9 [Gigaspora margarita]|uniref:Plant intracellular ras-group-related lrr protein 9 n=1 Tax=Gigaspora margarita TaxID=4874 RepID=A0A8H4AF95_GIGMA|nr:plant intracellular ras-group-related lrr protein 9 [Gigaspora margarita]